MGRVGRGEHGRACRETLPGPAPVCVGGCRQPRRRATGAQARGCRRRRRDRPRRRRRDREGPGQWPAPAGAASTSGVDQARPSGAAHRRWRTVASGPVEAASDPPGLRPPRWSAERRGAADVLPVSPDGSRALRRLRSPDANADGRQTEAGSRLSCGLVSMLFRGR